MKFFTIEELTKSTTAQQKGIKNVPSKEEEQNLIALIENVLDPLREAYGKPIIVTSGYRCPALNRAVGGASTSQHMTGQAADIRTVLDTKSENKKLFDLAQKSSIVLLGGGGFAGPEWSIRISLANLYDEAYSEIGVVLKRILDSYADDWKKLQG